MKQPDTMPFGRALLHRATGRIVGPVSSVYTEDWPLQVVPDNETLWRYLEFFKFEDLLKTSSLYFARPDTFDDPFEGRFSIGNAHGFSKSDLEFRKLYNIANETDVAARHDLHRNVIFISCWQRSSHELRQMWNAYTKTNDSVVVATSVKALRRFTPTSLMKFGVRYDPLEKARTEFGHNSLFFYKPTKYASGTRGRAPRSSSG